MTERETLPPNPDGLPDWDDREPQPRPADDGSPAQRTPEELDRRIHEGPGSSGPHVTPDLGIPDNQM
jgi:hypothetical protein